MKTCHSRARDFQQRPKLRVSASADPGENRFERGWTKLREQFLQLRLWCSQRRVFESFEKLLEHFLFTESVSQLQKPDALFTREIPSASSCNGGLADQIR